MRKLKLFFACLLMAVLSIGQVWATDDVINNAATSSALGSTGTTTWKSPDPVIVGASGASYTIHSMGTSGTTNAIQWNKNGFLYQTKSGGTLKSVTIKGAAKKINIFASNTAYSAKATGTQLAQVTASTSGVTYTFESDYTYLAINGTESSTSITEITVAYQSGGGGDPSVSLTPSSLDLDAENVANQSVTITTSDFAGDISSVTTGLYSDAECTSEITSGAWVKNVTVNGEKTAVTFDVDDNNTGVARECWLKVSATDGTGNASAAVHIAQKKIVVDYATLPFSFSGGKADIETTDGMTQSGLGSDYSATEKLKFDNTGDWLKIKINADPGKLSYQIKGNSFSGGTFTIQQSTDDETYSDLATYTADGSVELALAKTTRYVKFIYTSKSSGNIGLGNIAISLPVDVEAPTISGVTPFLSSTEVTLTQNDADAIYFTTDEAKKENPSVDTWTEYNSASKPSFNATTTIYAAAIKGSAWSAVAEQTFTKATVLTVAEAIAAVPNPDDVVNDQYVSGVVCTAGTSVSAAGKMTYYISADGYETTPLQIYLGKNLNNTAFSDVTDIAIGDRVVVFGQLKNYKGTPEMNDGNYLVLKESPAVATPVVTPNGGGFMGETDVTITCATGSSTIYYTLDGTNPTKLSTLYEGAIHLTATTTINAIAFVGDDPSLIVSKTFTLTAPMTVAEALAALDSEDPINNVAVAGIISTAPTSNPSGGKLTYFISDDGTATDELQVYLGFGLNGAAFSDKTDLQEGDHVTVFGNLKIHNYVTKEFDTGSRLLAFDRPAVAVEGVTLPATVGVKVGGNITLTPTITPDNATNKNVSWSVKSGDAYAEVNAAGVVTGKAVGTAVIEVETEDGHFTTTCTVTVSEAVSFNDPTHEWQLVTDDDQLKAGKYYVLGSSSKGKVVNRTISSGYAGEETATFADGVIAYNGFGSEKTADASNASVFQLSGTTDAWTLTEANEGKVLTGATTANLAWDGASNTTWVIAIDEDDNAILGASAGYRILHNVSASRFKPYNSATSNVMLLPQLYVWAEKVFKLRYDANGGTNAPAATLPVAGKATVTDERPTAPAGKIFDGWNENATGTGEDYVAGDEIAITTADVTIYAKWRDPNTYTISYNANGGTLMEGKSVIAPEDVTEGEEYSVKANVYEKEGKIFTGWQYGANIYNANDELLPTEDIEFIAQWSDPNITDYVLVTNINQLKNGDKVYIVAAATGNAMGAQYSTTYRQRVEIEKTADKSHVITTGTEPVELTLGTTDGSYYTFNDGTGYLYANSTTANNIGTQEDLTDAGKWTITIDAEGNTTIVSQGETQYNKLTYNASQPRFAAYKNAQQAVVLYKKLETIREDGVAPGVWGTICPKNEIVNAEGASFFKISYVEYHSGVPYKVFYDEIAEGENLAAGQPYLFQADEDATAIKGFKIGDDATSAINDHGFIGVLENETISVVQADVDAYKYYIVYNNEIRLCGVGQFLVRAERAYLDLSDPTVEKQYKAPVAGRRRVALTNNAAEEAQGFENLDASEKPLKVMIEGQLYILRGERVYDATGRLVK